MGDQKLVQKIPFRSHHLNAVIPRLAGAHGSGDNIRYLLLDAFSLQFFGGERRDWGFNSRRRHAILGIGIATSMQNLHRDLTASVMHAIGHNLMVGNVIVGKQTSGTRKHATLSIGGHAASDHQGNATSRTGRIKLCDAVPVAGFFQSGMHRPHQHTVL